MKSAATLCGFSLRCQTTVFCLWLCLLTNVQAQQMPVAVGGTPAKSNNWSAAASMGLKEVYDGNIYMQSVTRLADHGSFATVITPMLGAEWKPAPAFAASLTYSPEIAFYHAASAEDYVAHRGSLNFGGKIEDATWELLSSVAWTTGNETSPSFFGPGGAPALGGVPLRDRRAAEVYQDSFKLQIPMGDWFVRSVASAQVYNYRTEQRANPPGGVYQNYADHDDFNGGPDIGYEIHEDIYLVAGYRHGSQDQARVLTNPIDYSNTYNRALAGVEGSRENWLRWSLLMGPDFRRFGPQVPAGFSRNKVKIYLEAAATLTLGERDAVIFASRRFEQPGYGGASAYEDSTYEVKWNHRFSKKFSTSLGLRALNWNFELPENRNEWWYNANVSATYFFTSRWRAEAAVGYDLIQSLVPNTTGRECRRPIGSFGMKYVF